MEQVFGLKRRNEQHGGNMLTRNLTQYMGRPLRVMQLHTLYGGYVDALYKAHPLLVEKSYHEQLQTLIRDAYSAIHMMSPYLIGCESFLTMANWTQAQCMWLKEYGLPCSQETQEQQDIVRLQVENFKPDILYITSPTVFNASFLETLSYIPPCILGWRAADIPAHIDWSGFDAILSGLPKLLALAKTLGANDGIMFHPGMPTWIAREVMLRPHEVDVVFVGSVSPKQHVQRRALLEILAEAATEHGFSLELYLLCEPSSISPVMRPYVHPPVFGLEMHKVLRRGRIVVDDRAWHGVLLPNGQKTMDLGGEDTSNMRLFEGTGGGSLVLTEHLEGVSRYFEIDKEVVTYKNHAEAVEKILYYLQHEEERGAIAKAGQARCLKDWNMQVAVKKFLEIAQSILAKK